MISARSNRVLTSWNKTRNRKTPHAISLAADSSHKLYLRVIICMVSPLDFTHRKCWYARRLCFIMVGVTSARVIISIHANTMWITMACLVSVFASIRIYGAFITLESKSMNNAIINPLVDVTFLLFLMPSFPLDPWPPQCRFVPFCEKWCSPSWHFLFLGFYNDGALGHMIWAF